MSGIAAAISAFLSLISKIFFPSPEEKVARWRKKNDALLDDLSKALKNREGNRKKREAAVNKALYKILRKR